MPDCDRNTFVDTSTVEMKIEYRPEIDGLRAIAVIAVVLFHGEIDIYNQHLFGGGYIGVDVFFVISGYLITSIILKGLRQGNFSFPAFYERRARRILPALLTVMIALTPVAVLLLIPWQVIDFAKSAIATVFFVSNIYFWNQSGYFSQDSAGMPLLHTWSLAIEEQFYILYPLFLLLIWKYFPRLLLPMLTAMILISVYMAEQFSINQSVSSFYLMPFRLWELLCGALLAGWESAHGRQSHPISVMCMPAIGLLMITGAVLFFDETITHPGYYTLLPVAGTMLIIWYTRAGESITGVLSSRPLVYTGLISYSLYLWHYPIFAFSHALKLPLDNLQSMLMMVISFILAMLTYRYVEIPFRNRSISLNRAFFTGIAAVSILLISTVVVLASKGGLGRYSPADLEVVSVSPNKYGEYVRSRFFEFENKPFINSDKSRLLIIGDSYAQDLVNAIVETGLNEGLQLSTYLISRRCGNLFVDQDLSVHIEANYQRYCDRQKGYEDPDLQARMKQADVIWLVSSWQVWQAELLPQSLANIRAMSDARLLVIGRKNFGDFNPYELIETPLQDRSRIRLPVSSSHRETNEYMKRALAPGEFLDLQEILCNEAVSCPIFDQENRLISFDGNHLTRAGAILLGNKLKQEPSVLGSLSRLSAAD